MEFVKMNQSNDSLPARPNLSFESLKKHNRYGIEYWSARDLQPCLGYTEWRTFENTIKKAMMSCKQSGNNPQNHFVGAHKMVLRVVSRLLARHHSFFYGIFKRSPFGISQTGLKVSRTPIFYTITVVFF